MYLCMYVFVYLIIANLYIHIDLHITCMYITYADMQVCTYVYICVCVYSFILIYSFVYLFIVYIYYVSICMHGCTVFSLHYAYLLV